MIKNRWLSVPTTPKRVTVNCALSVGSSSALVDGIRLSSMPELEQQHWLDCWTWRGRGDLVEDFKNDPESVLVASDRLVFVSYDEQLYKDLKAHQDKRVAEM